jgi:hypothetical protein
VKAPKRRATFFPAYLLATITVACVGVLAWGLAPPPSAGAQVPDSGAQRLRMIAQLRTSNEKLTEIAGLLREIRDQRAPARPGDPAKRKPVARP